MRWTKFYWILECLWELLKLAIYLVSDMHVHADSFHLYPDRQDLWSLPRQVDQVVLDVGMPMGTFEVSDLSGEWWKSAVAMVTDILVAASISFVNPLRETDKVSV